MSQIQTDLKWNKLTSFPFRYLSQPVVINNDEFMVAATNYNLSNGDGIYKFNVHKNEWIKIFCYHTNFECYTHSAVYDNEHKLLHCNVGDYPAKMVTFDLKTKDKITIKKQQHRINFRLIFAENKLHQICNSAAIGGTPQNGDHYVYDATEQFQKITTFQSFDGLMDYGLIYLKSQNSIFALGGSTFLDVSNAIYRFSCVDSKWKELNIRIPTTLSVFGLVSTTNEQYIIILGGMTDINVYSNDIFIYDTRHNIITKSKMKCPKKASYHAIIMNNSNRDEITSFGFINDCYKAENLVGMQLLPHYLIKIIGCYFCNEEIYLLERGTGKHWEINVDHILHYN